MHWHVGNGSPQERRIWDCQLHPGLNGWSLNIVVPHPDQEEVITISQIREKIQRHVQKRTIVTDITIRLRVDPRPTEEELAMLGHSCRPLVNDLQRLSLNDILSAGWTDSEASCVLRNMSLHSSSKIDYLYVDGKSGETFSTTIRLLHDKSPASLRMLIFWGIGLASNDCKLLGKLASNKERAFTDIRLGYCSFPSLTDILTLLVGFIKDRKNAADGCLFQNCKVEDDTIPKHSRTEDNGYLDLRRIFVEFWKRRNGEPVSGHYATRLENSVRDLSNYYGPMQRAGLSRLVMPSEERAGNGMHQPKQRREWVKALGHRAVNDRVDLLFHILTLNPAVCVLEPALRSC